MRLLQNVYLVSGPMYGSHQNVYAVRCGGSIVLIDSGLDRRDYDIIQRNLSYWNLDDFPVARLLLTHAHCEHSGNAHHYREAGARVAIHETEAEAVEKGTDRTAIYAFMQLDKFGTCSIDDRLEDGSVIEQEGMSFRVIHTPGHSDGSVVYELKTEGKLVLFTGDTLLADMLCRRCALGWTGGVDYNREKYVNSLYMLSHRKADLVLPGHGEICMKDGSEFLGGGHLRARLELVNGPVRVIPADNYFREGV